MTVYYYNGKISINILKKERIKVENVRTPSSP
jgi:hypothetical protein